MTPSRVEQAEGEVRFDRLILTRFAAAVRSFASSDEGWKAKGLFGLLIAFLFAINGLNVVNSYVARDFMTAIASRDRARFISQATLYIGVFAASTITAVLYRFSEERLALRWRWWVTRELLTHYLARRAYYYLEATDQIANPDERIAEDARAFTTTTLSFMLLFLNGTFTVLAFASVLWSISTLLFGVAVAYAALGSVLTIVLGRPLIWLNYNQLDQEANLRADLIHLRQNAELVALSHHEARHGARLLQRLDSLTANWRRVTAVNRNLAFFTTGYNYMIQIIPALVIAPLFLRGEVEFGVITQSAISFSYLLGAFSLIVTQFQSISSFAAVVARLNSLTQATDRAEAGHSLFARAALPAARNVAGSVAAHGTGAHGHRCSDSLDTATVGHRRPGESRRRARSRAGLGQPPFARRAAVARCGPPAPRQSAVRFPRSRRYRPRFRADGARLKGALAQRDHLHRFRGRRRRHAEL